MSVDAYIFNQTYWIFYGYVRLQRGRITLIILPLISKPFLKKITHSRLS